MIPTSKKNTNLSDDIRKIIISAYGENMEMIRLCKDHPEPFLHYDKFPVLNISQDDFVGIFDLNSNHYFLSPAQVSRLGTYCKLALPKLIALMLKAEWEGFLSEIAGYSTGSGLSLGSILSDRELIEMYIPDFKPNNQKIFNLIRDIPYGSKANKSYSHVEFFISDLLENHDFLMENKQLGKSHSEKDISENILLHKIPEAQRDTYLRLKELWKVKSTELDEMLLNLERKKRLNMGIENKYYDAFGNIETKKSGFIYRVKKYKIILAIMRDHPETAYRELVELAGDKMIEADREINDLKKKIARSRNCIEDNIPEHFRSTASHEFKTSYMQECKKLLRELFFLLHSDTCPNYSGLSRKKKTEINKLWLELMKSTKDELYSFSPTMLLYSLPDYEQLESIYKRACEILGKNPDDFELGNRLEFLVKKGTPIIKILEFLISETKILELHLAHLELVQEEYTNEGQSQIYRIALLNKSAHSESLEREISELKKQILQLKKKISNGFKELVK